MIIEKCKFECNKNEEQSFSRCKALNASKSILFGPKLKGEEESEMCYVHDYYCIVIGRAWTRFQLFVLFPKGEAG